MLFNVEIKGFQEALEGLKKFRNPQRQKVLQKAVRAAGNKLASVMRKAAKLHDKTGTMRKSIKVKVKYYKSTDTMIAVIGIGSKDTGRNQYGKKVIPALYGHLPLLGRKAFVQKFLVQPGKAFATFPGGRLIMVTNRSGKAIQIQRRIGAVTGDNYILAAMRDNQSLALDAARKAIDGIKAV